jgi:hypothetical protein
VVTSEPRAVKAHAAAWQLAHVHAVNAAELEPAFNTKTLPYSLRWQHTCQIGQAAHAQRPCRQRYSCIHQAARAARAHAVMLNTAEQASSEPACSGDDDGFLCDRFALPPMLPEPNRSEHSTRSAGLLRARATYARSAHPRPACGHDLQPKVRALSNATAATAAAAVSAVERDGAKVAVDRVDAVVDADAARLQAPATTVDASGVHDCSNCRGSNNERGRRRTLCTPAHKQQPARQSVHLVCISAAVYAHVARLHAPQAWSDG